MAAVLFVDDEMATRKAVRTWLVRRGHTVHEASDLAQAQRVLLEHRVDGVFVDLWIGRESGIELLGWIDDLDPDLARNVAFITGDLFATVLAERGFGHPIYMKPFQLSDLDMQIDAWTSGRPSPLMETPSA